MILENPIVFFDLETTGVNTSTDRIVQIGVIKIDTDGTTDEKKILINPNMAIPAEATEVHGITDEMVKDKPFFVQISKSLNEFLYGCDLAGYNSDRFDIPLLSEEFARCGIAFPSWDPSFVDVMKIERIVNSNKLTDVFQRYTGTVLDEAHDALADVKATKTVLEHQFEKFAEKLSSLADGKALTAEVIDRICQGDKERFDLAGKCYIKEGEVFWSFGKHINKPVLSDPGYLSWVLTSDFPSETKSKLIDLRDLKS